MENLKFPNVFLLDIGTIIGILLSYLKFVTFTWAQVQNSSAVNASYHASMCADAEYI